MAQIDEIISKEALDNVEKLTQLLGKAVTSLDAVIQKSSALDSTLTKMTASSKSAAAAQNEVNSATTQAKGINDQLSKSEEEVVKAKIKYAQASKAQRDEIRDSMTLADAEAGTLEKLAARNSQLRNERKKLNLETSEGRKKLKEINDELDKNNKKIKDNNDSLGKQKINIGNYASAIGGLPGPIQMAMTAFQAFTSVIVANPIGIIILAIVGSIALLVKAFKRTEEGGDAIAKVFQQIKAVLTVLIDRISGVATTLFKIFTGEAKLRDLKGAFAGVSDEIKKQTELAGQLFEMMDKLEEQEADAIITMSVRRNKIAELREAAADTNKTDAERLRLLTEARRLIREEADEEQKLQLVRIANALRTTDLAKAEEIVNRVRKGQLLTYQELTSLTGQNKTVEDLKAVNEEIAKYINAESSADMETRRLTTTIAGLNENLGKQEQLYQANVIKMNKDANEQIKLDDFELYDWQKENADAAAEAMQESIDATVEAEREAAEKRKEYNQQVYNLLVEIANESFELASTLYDRQYAKLELNEKKELALAGDDAEKKAAIEDKYEKKKAAIKKKQAKTEKAQAIFNIGISTAEAIIKAYAQFGPIAGTALVPLILAVAALQTAIVLAKPIPQYAKGTNYAAGGASIVGEKGSELIVDPSGRSWLSGDSPELVNLSRGSKVIPSDETKRIMAAAGGMRRSDMEAVQERRHKELIKTIKEKDSVILNVGTGNSIEKRSGNTYKKYFERHLQ